MNIAEELTLMPWTVTQCDDIDGWVIASAFTDAMLPCDVAVHAANELNRWRAARSWMMPHASYVAVPLPMVLP